MFNGKWVITTNLGTKNQLKSGEPSVVLTYAGQTPPYVFRADYEFGDQVKGYICKLGSSERRVSVTKKGDACQALYFRDGETQTIFSSPSHAAKCSDAASTFVNTRLKEIGATCRPK